MPFTPIPPGPFAQPGRAETAGRRNMLLLMQLRWLAVAGQAVTILSVHLVLGVKLPLVPMLGVLTALVALNLVTRATMRVRDMGNSELFLSLLFDVAALSMQLYLSGGVTNPFISLYLLQVVLGALLLDVWSSWALVGAAGTLFGLLAISSRPLDLPPALAITLSPPHIFALWLNFLLAAVLLVQFLTRISRNLRDRDAYLAQMRQRAAEEDHIVRMGLLASGAAHELGTPLSSLAVILADWKQEAPIAADSRLSGELEEMQAEVLRCKAIVKGILYASGEVLGDTPAPTTLRTFVRDVASGWDALHPNVLRFVDRLGSDMAIIADRSLAQVIGNVLDNSLEASARAMTLSAERRDDALVLTLEDDGSGFPVEMLETLGKPYQTSKGKRGGGLGLFLAVNVLRKLGGSVAAHNRPGGGAEVTLTLPLSSLAMESARG
ncbi:ATP-binding protein [Sphingomonas sp. MMS12-HWE2-04]|uniref:ATP-binding protein n=1 Tax=Sphingomonas sp. MMS12-HWE2-04 TaxID=3234199 RepID=UPI0038513394